MNLYILFYLFDIKKVFYNKSIENKIKYYNYFYKLQYNEDKYTIQNLLLCIPNDYIIYESNKMTINEYGLNKLSEIEESILNNINIILNKKIELSIYNECRKKKYFMGIKRESNMILRISGIWESYDKIGITYKFILQ
tara:strand:+ start:1534 stop:1947 length:414 start_codon:yes stop_codon:yes gene_type:complete